MSYEELSEQVRSAGLYKRQYGYYALYFVFICLGLLTVVYTLSITDSFFIQVLNGIFCAFVLVQAGMLGHDFSHQQVFNSPRLNHVGGIIMWCLFGGISAGGWYDKHNAHHKYVNHEGHDPDLGIPFIFSDVQIENKSNFVKKYIQPYQHWLFFIVLPFVYPNFVLWSFKRVLTTVSLNNVIELLLIAVHFVIFFYVPIYFLPIPVALTFLITVLLASGAYMGIVFAPNHKGEEVVASDAPATWLHQITLTRNLNPTWYSFYIFGGLDLQIEHHLFPHVSRFNYPAIHRIVKAYCVENNIRYYETSWLNSMKEIYQSLEEHRR